MVADRFVPMRAGEGCEMVAGSGSGSVHRGDFWMVVPRLRGVNRGACDCGDCGGHRGSWIVGARVGADRGHFGRWFFHVDCGVVYVEDFLDESSDVCRRVVWSLNCGCLGRYLVDVRGGDLGSPRADGDHVAHRQSRAFWFAVGLR